MKLKIVTITFFISVISNLFSQSYWDVSHYGINLFQTGNIKYAIGDSSMNKIGKTIHPMCSFYGILPDDGWWIYGDGSGLLLAAIGIGANSSPKNYHASLYEFGAGWSFNNNRPIEFGNFAEMKIVMGVALGARYFRTIKNMPNSIGVGIFPLEFGAMVNIKDRIAVLAKFGFQPLYNGEVIGGRIFYDVRTTLKLGERFGLSCTFIKNRYNYKEGEQVSYNNLQNSQEKEIYKFFSTQIGITFIASK